MAKETQKLKIERLEKENETLRQKIKEMMKNQHEMDKIRLNLDDKNDEEFRNSYFKKSMDKQIWVLEQKLKQAEHTLDFNDKSLMAKDKLIEELDSTVKKLNKMSTQQKNARNAGRKPMITEETVHQVKKLREEGKTLMEIKENVHLSYGAVHKIINQKKEDHQAKEGMLIYDDDKNCYDIYYQDGTYYGGLCGGEAVEVSTELFAEKWISTRIEKSAEWYLVGLENECLTGLRVRI